MEPLSKCKEYIVVGKKSDDLGRYHTNILLIQMRYIAFANGFINQKKYVLFKEIFFIWLNNPEMVFFYTFCIK